MLAIYTMIFLISLILTIMLFASSIIEFRDKNYIPAILLAISSLAAWFAVLYFGPQLLKLLGMSILGMFIEGSQGSDICSSL